MSDPLNLLAKLKATQQVKADARPASPTEISFSMDDFAPANVAKIQAGQSDIVSSVGNSDGAFDLSAEDFVVTKKDHGVTPEGVAIEKTSRETLTRMIQTCAMDEPFTFYVPAYRGESYVNAMRVLFARVKNDMRNKRVKVQEFKIIQRSIKRKGNLDEVILMRVRPGKGGRNSGVYTTLETLLEAK